jgi:hypothetical protein
MAPTLTFAYYYYFLNTRIYYEDLAKGGKIFYKDFVKYLSNISIEKAHSLKNFLKLKETMARMTC